MSEKFCLKWNDFHSNVSKSFSSLRHENDFYDVTLVSDDQKQISAHKVVLSACSEYFKNILKKNKHQNPLLCLEGISSDDLNNILDYVYHGEVNIYQDNLDRFFNIAERFKLEGLLSNNTAKEDEEVDETKYFLNDTKNIVTDEIEICEENKMAPQKMKMTFGSEEFSNIEDLDAKILELIERDIGKGWKCTICNKATRDKTSAKEHVEIHFEGLSFPCSECDAVLRSRNSLRFHINNKHKMKR